jgi:hypothetical protein
VDYLYPVRLFPPLPSPPTLKLPSDADVDKVIFLS